VTVAIVTDSAAALPSELIERHRIEVVPLWLHIAGATFRDDELALDEVLAQPAGAVKTAAPAPAEFAERVERARREGPVVVLTLASSMSAVHQSALIGARSVDARVPVIDTRTAAGAQALVVLAAARAAEGGAGVEAVVAAARTAIARVRLVAFVADLERLVASGRVPDAARWLADRLGARPLFEMRGGRPRPLRPAFSRDGALDRIVASCLEDRRRTPRLHVAVLSARDADVAEDLRRRLERRRHLDAQELASCFVGSFSPAMVAHTGGEVAGLAWWYEP
jgi:DegV family protein with EDD domain